MATHLDTRALNLCKTAARNGDLQALKQHWPAGSNLGVHMTKLLCIAAENEHEAVTRWLLTQFRKDPNTGEAHPEAYVAIAAAGNLKALELLHKVGGESGWDLLTKSDAEFGPVDMRVLAAAARSGHLAILDWLKSGENRFYRWEAWHQVVLAAVEGRQLSSLEWLRGQNPEGTYDRKTGQAQLGRIFFEAGKQGDLSVVKWLVKRFCGSSVSAPSSYWELVPNPAYTCLHAACGIAAANGHLAVLQWAFNICPDAVKTCSPQIWAVEGGQIDVFCWIREQLPDLVNESELVNESWGNYTKDGVKLTFTAAAANQYEMLTWLVEQGYPWWTQEVTPPLHLCQGRIRLVALKNGAPFGLLTRREAIKKVVDPLICLTLSLEAKLGTIGRQLAVRICRMADLC